MVGTIVSIPDQTIDYQVYAAENPEKLAKAIESGIPHTLRGMMWQLMYAFFSVSRFTLLWVW